MASLSNQVARATRKSISYKQTTRPASKTNTQPTRSSLANYTLTMRTTRANSSTMMLCSTAALIVLSTCLIGQTSAQGIRPPSMAGIVNLLRFQNTACHNDQDESGTCLAEAECSRRAGISIGTCANGWGACCSFKVSRSG